MSKIPRVESKKSNILKRNKAVQRRFKELYNEKRLRFDDVKKQLSDEFFLAENTILKILNSDLSES